ncbi:M48 family metallopeptidase [Horticoccus luteus]|uniref:M48 family metallopeptidase n=1 Tax=Horticoccus luteus TaxID=2862869 RepID=A0A8F9TXK4_9BACT|nr:M48 family metallopeptidase [Horticoccus luteus]QYM79714.1 M48 family metallopeptidase [Horticoccus luteus]
MDFFAAQARAKKRTSRLLVLFALAVIGTVVAEYAVGLFVLGAQHARQSDPYGDYVAPLPDWWQPQLLVGVALGTLVVVALAAGYKWSQFSAGGSAVAENVGGRRVDPHTTDPAERRFLNVVEEMAIASGVPVPAAYVLDDEAAINAFAAGHTTSDAVVAVTRGTLQRLTRDELQGVVGHEFSHILNGDMRLNVRLAAFVFGILVIGLLGRGVIASLRYTRVRSSRESKSGGGIAVIFVIGIALFIIGYIGYFFGRLIQAAVSRQREFLADASSVQFTRNPAGLTGALKKIGGLALGSKLDTTKSAEIGHFFFAQAFRSSFGGLWATHPPLSERIRAIDPAFDGQYSPAPEVVDVRTESFASAGLGHRSPAPLPPVIPGPLSPAAIVASIGTLNAALVADAQTLLNSLPAGLRTAARTPNGAAALVCALLLDPAPASAAQQRQLIATHLGPDTLREIDALASDITALSVEQKLPLIQIAAPTLRDLPAPRVAALLETLDALVLADQRVTSFEFALQKLVQRALKLGRAPTTAPGEQIFSFEAVAPDLNVVLSALARASSDDETAIARAFATGAGQLKLIADRLSLLPSNACELPQLDTALERLATASGPIKHRLLTACAASATADGVLRASEAELLRAVSAVLDCPMPPLALSPA